MKSTAAATGVSRGSRRGSALMMTVLVVLILTIIGIGVAYLTQVEDKFSGNDRTAHSGFYAAEAGLRVGEKLISAAFSDASDPRDASAPFYLFHRPRKWNEADRVWVVGVDPDVVIGVLRSALGGAA